MHCAVNPATALGLFKTLDVPKGEWMLQTAAGSGLGALLCRCLLHKHNGAECTALLVGAFAALRHGSSTRPSSQGSFCVYLPLQLSRPVQLQAA